MLRILIFVGVLVLTIAEDGVLVINKISRMTTDAKDAGEKQIELCFDGSALGGYNHMHLSAITDLEGSAAQIQGNAVKYTVLTNCATFAGDIETLGTDPVDFILTGKDKDDVTKAFGTAIIKLPDFLPELTAHWVDGDSLRIQGGDVKDFKIDEVECSKGDGTPCYFMQIPTPGDHKPVLQLCTDKTEESPSTKTITICDLTQKGATSIGAASPDKLKSMELQYDISGAVRKMVMEREDAVTSEIVVYDQNNFIKICGTPVNPYDCDIAGYAQGDKPVSILVVGINTNPTDSKVYELTDMNLVGNALSTTLLEVRWTDKSDVVADKYFATRTAGTPAGLKKEFLSTIVTCHNSDEESGFHCFGYFTGLVPANSYAVTIQPGDGANNVDTNKVTLAGTPMTSEFNRKDNTIQINAVNFTWQKSLSSFVTDICFNGDLAADLSQYQVIITGNHGQWHKVSGASVTPDMKICFENVVLDAHKFHLDDPLFITVVKRAENMVDVLASGERKVHFVDTTAPLLIEKIHQIMDHHRQEVLTKVALTHSHHLEGLSSLDIHVHHDKTYHQVEGIRLPRSSLLAPHELTFNIDLPDFIRKHAKVLLIGRNAHGTVVTAQKINNI